MRRILFVDDEPRVLEGLKRTLEPYQQQWEVSFALGGEAALRELEAAAPYDVIVSDIWMPGMDGPALLGYVRERFPQIVRIAHSGYTSMEAALRAVPVAHQFLAKPCDPDMLRLAVERALSLKALLGSELLCHLVGSMQELPNLPRTYASLSAALGNPETSLDEIAAIVEHDVAVSAKVLQLVNSALFGLVRHISTIKTAVAYLGVDVLRNLVLSVETFRAFEGCKEIPGFSVAKVHAHASLTARIASSLPTVKYLKEAAYLAALLHDAGKLVLMARLPEHFERVIERVQEENRPMFEVEEEMMGTTHAEIGAYLLGLWGLPYPIVESVAYHHAPTRIPRSTFDPLATVYVANILAHEPESPRGLSNGMPHAKIDMSYLESLGVADLLPGWQAMAAETSKAYYETVQS